MKAVDPGDGYRMLSTGERIKTTDEYTRDGGRTWKVQKRGNGGKWRSHFYWPMRRKTFGLPI